jgi:hypothetical protein
MTAINNGRWTITSDGGDGDNASKDANRKWTKEKFEMVFPTMSRFDSAGENAVSKVLAKLEEILPPENRDHGVDIGKGHDDAFFVEGTAKDGNRITVSYFYKINKTTRNIKNKCTVVLRQGNKRWEYYNILLKSWPNVLLIVYKCVSKPLLYLS